LLDQMAVMPVKRKMPKAAPFANIERGRRRDEGLG
jgi:hypothetical protein